MAMAQAAGAPETGSSNEPAALAYSVERIDGTPARMSYYLGKVVLVVNVASQCGYTPQYEGLEALYKKHSKDGLAIVAFPSNDFGGQEPGTNQEIQSFCRTKYGVDFDLMAKIQVKGDQKHPFYQFLTSTETNPEFGGEIGWNFVKFLISREGKVVARFPSSVPPLSREIVSAVEAQLAVR